MAMNFRTLSIVSLALMVASANAVEVKTIFSSLPGSLNSVPGYPSDVFNPAYISGTSTNSGGAFRQPYLSPDGTRWLMRCQIDTSFSATTGDDTIIYGQGLNTSSFGSATRTGEIVPWDPGTVWNALGNQIAINNAGLIAFRATVAAGASVTDTVCTYNAGTFTQLLKQGDAAPGLSGLFLRDADGIHFGTDGTTVRARWRIQTGATTEPDILLNGNTLLAQSSGLTLTSPMVPTTLAGQMVAPSQTLKNTGLLSFRTSADGSASMYFANLNGPTTSDFVLVLNGNVIAQEGAVLPGSGNPSTVVTFGNSSSHNVANGGNYIYRGTWNDGPAEVTRTNFVVKNGSVISMTGNTLSPFMTEAWEDDANGTVARVTATYFTTFVNSYGEFVIGGSTNNADVNVDTVLVANNRRVILREGDPIDLNNNGNFDDDCFVNLIKSDGCAFSDNAYLYQVVQTENSTGAITGEAFLRIEVPIPADIDGDGEVGSTDFDAVVSQFGNGGSDMPEDVDGDGEVGSTDFDLVVAQFGRSR